MEQLFPILAPDEVSVGQLGMFGNSALHADLKSWVPEIALRRPATDERWVSHRVAGVEYLFAQPITFTPFASAQPCSARCFFCSETLRTKETRTLAASLRPGPNYFAELAAAMRELIGLPLSFSLSGLESTDDASWFLSVIQELDAFEEAGGIVQERVLYTNGAGLCEETTGSLLLPRLQRFRLTRAELSRHHYNETTNQEIMRFRLRRPIVDNPIFEKTVRASLGHFPVRLVCIIQRGGIDSSEEILNYIHWAASLGVTDIVFRELSRLGDLYQSNRPALAVEEARLPIEEIIRQCLQDVDFRSMISPELLMIGYYFWNLRVRFASRVRVTFETSDYAEMKRMHSSGRVYKLVFHANGNLCGDWDPETNVLFRASGS